MLAFSFFSTQSHAIQTYGRISIGAAATTEKLNATSSGSERNDTLFSSQRFFYKVSEIGENQWEVTTDLRNKYDSFGKLNKELFQLDSKDEFQVLQLNTRMVNPNGNLSPSLGRFQVPEAGAVIVDGINLQYRLTSNWYSGLFGGLNPKQADKANLVSDSKATETGAFLTYQKKTGDWDTNQYLSHGLVQQKYNGQNERQFIFHNGVYQWQANSRVMSLVYLDFAPRTHVQTMYLMYQQGLSTSLSFEIGQLGIDGVEYLRRQNVLEKLDPSSYKESHVRLDYRVDSDQTLSLTSSAGERSVDQLKRTDVGLGYRLQNFISKKWDTQFMIIRRKNFTSQDNIISWSLGYFSKTYEIIIDADYAIQKNDDGLTTHPLNTELSFTNFFSKEIFASAVLQRSADEAVTILGTFIKFGYRFGNKELPPIRDGAAPRGSL